MNSKANNSSNNTKNQTRQQKTTNQNNTSKSSNNSNNSKPSASQTQNNETKTSTSSSTNYNTRQAVNTIGRDIYNLTDGRIKLGSFQEGGGRAGARQALAETVYNYTTQGTRDRENNSFFDNKMRFNKTIAVMSAVGHTAKENAVINTYNNIDWNSSKIQTQMTKMGILSNNSQQYLNSFLSSNTVVVPNNEIKNVNEDKITLGDLKLNNSQKASLINTGKFTFEGQEYHIKDKELSEVRKAYNAAKIEIKNNNNITKALTGKDKELVMQQIKSKQTDYLKKISVTGGFNGSLASTKKEIKAIDDKLEILECKLKSVNNATDLHNFKSQIAELKDYKESFMLYKETGAITEDFDRGAGRKKYGRSIIAQNIIGSDMYRGTKFIQNSSKAIISGARLTIKTTTKASAGLVSAATYIPRKTSPNSKAGIISNNINNNAQKYKNNINDKIRHKTKEEKKAQAKERKVTHKAEALEKREKRLERTEARINILKTGKLTDAEEKRLQKLTEKIDSKKIVSNKELNEYTELLNKKEKGILTRKDQKALTKQQKVYKARTTIYSTPDKVKETVKDGLKKSKGVVVKKVKTTKAYDKYTQFKNGKFYGNAMKVKGKVRNSKIGKASKDIRYTILHPFKTVKKIKDMIIDKPLMFIKKYLLKILGTVIALYLLLIGFAFVMLLPILGIGSFFDSLPSSTISNELAQINYVQLIVNDTANNLGKELTKTAIKDAETHFISENGAVSSTKYDWKKSVSEGSIKHIWATEDLNKDVWDRTELAGVSANLLPITSMMHYRYNQSIDFDNYLTAKAYIYYMYVRSHDTAADENGNIYSYDTLADCSNDSLYVTKPTYDIDNSKVTRGVESCTNVYVHGYSSDYNKAINKARAELGDFLNMVQSALGIGHPDGTNEDNGVFIDKKPYDSKGECDNYEAFQAGVGNNYTNCGKEEHDHNKEGCSKAWYNGDDICTIEEHIHNDDCYIHHKTFLGYDNCEFGDIHEETDSCYELQFLPQKTRVYFNECSHSILIDINDYKENDEYYCEECEQYRTENRHFDGYFEWVNVQVCNGHHEHNENCAKYDEYTELICTKEEHSHEANGETLNWTCGKEGHIHNAWHSENDPGCYKTAYICMGHCGGHISPTINISQDMSYTTLSKLDNFKTPKLITQSDFSLCQIKETYKTIDAWQNHWITTFNSWYYFPLRGPIQSIEWKAKKLTQGTLTFANWAVGKINGSEISYKDDDKYKMEGYDLFEFEGWTKEQNGDWVIKQEVLDDLKLLYGDYYDDKYAMGIQNWDAFQVSFPSAVNESLSSTQIDDTLTKIKKENSLTPKQEAIIKEGLNAVGNYYYSESKNSPNAHLNAVYGRKIDGQDTYNGPADASGFLIGIIRRGIISVNGYNGLIDENTDFYGQGFVTTDYKVGDILSSADGKCAMYLGALEKGIDNYSVLTMKSHSSSDKQNKTGFYVLECSKDYGGVVVRKVTKSELEASYTHCYRI